MNIPLLWSYNDRDIFRRNNKLPIFSSRDIFINRLINEHVLIVVAETGSGKSTQLPQYMSEAFNETNGLIVCTQPRSLAAVSIAQRVANEFDGFSASVGNSVGYKVGKDSISGDKIMFMTDSQLIREMNKYPTLSHIRGILIDEAHERSINTDIILGIAKHILKQRPKDFYIVIASATIDPNQFLKFFDISINKELRIPGKIFPVEIFYWSLFESDEKKKLIPKVNHEKIVAKILEAVQKYKIGHTLVFLPGLTDIEKCIELFDEKKSSEFFALPLYSQLDIDEQNKVIKFDEDKTDKSHRMVAFCTNIAETSLTVPGVMLVIDSGLAKESKYDEQKRTNVLELGWISKSSADQRKGRAGRLAPGTCIRLYTETTLERESIEPEINRSSIDLILLQLKVLNLEKIELITPPSDSKLKASIQNLKYAGAIDQYDESITELGSFYSQLSFEPKMSAFILDVYLKNIDKKIGIEIACLVSAQGNLFYLGNKETRKDDLKVISKKSSDHSSDIMFKLSFLHEWIEIGRIEESKCVNCKQKYSSHVRSCNKCRVEYTKEHKLNNKILKNIDKDIREYESVFENKCPILIQDKYVQNFFNLSTEAKEGNRVNYLQQALIDWFFEQSVQILIPSLPSKGIRLMFTDEIGNLSNVSCLVNNTELGFACTYAIAVSPFFKNKDPTGKRADFITADNLHPITWPNIANCKNKEWFSKLDQFLIEKVYERKSIGPKLRTSKIDNDENKKFYDNDWIVYFARQDSKLSKLGEEYWKFFIQIFDETHAKYTLYAPVSLFTPEIRQWIDTKFTNAYKKLTSFTYSSPFYYNGRFLVRLKPGFVCAKIEEIDEQTVLNVKNLKYTDLREFNSKFLKAYQIDTNDLIYSTYFIESKQAFLVFKDKKKLKIVQEKLKKDDSSVETSTKGVFVFDAQSNSYPQKDHLKASLEKICNKELNNFDINIKESTKLTIKITDLPGNFQSIDGKVIQIKSKMHTGKSMLIIECGNDENKFNQLHTNWSNNLSHYSFNSIIPGGKTVKVIPKIVAEKLFNWRLDMSSLDDADLIYQSRDNFNDIGVKIWTFYKFPVIKFTNITKFFSQDYLDSFRNDLDDKYLIKTKIDISENKGLEISIQDFQPKQLKEIQDCVNSKFEPIILTSSIRNDPTRTRFFIELFKMKNFLETWPSELNICVLKETEYRYKIYGEQISIGFFMMKLGECFDEFIQRFFRFNLQVEYAVLFQNNRIGASKLDEIKQKYDTTVNIEFKKNAIEIFLSENSAYNLTEVKLNVQDMIENLNKNIQLKDNVCCIQCGTEDKLKTLSICGHNICSECLSYTCKNALQFPIDCNRCCTPIELNDLVEEKDRLLKDTLLTKSVKYYMSLNSSAFEFILCKKDCDGLVRNNCYTVCKKCSESYCTICDIEDEIHKDLSCNEYHRKLIEIKKEEELRKERLRQLELERQRQEMERLRQIELERQRQEMERLRQIELERQRQEMERLRQIELERQRQEMERLRQLDLKRQEELERKRQEEERQKKFEELDTLFKNCEDWTRRNWSSEMKKKFPNRFQIINNEHLIKNSNSLNRFKQALSTMNLNIKNCLNYGIFSWHGTSQTSIDPICKEGFDPRKRSGQVHGQGEYFGLSPENSLGYCNNSNLMIVAFLIKSKITNTKPNFCYVVNNPLNFEQSFCLPVLIVNFGPNQISNLLNLNYKNQSNVIVKNPNIILHIKWQWQMDSGSFESFKDSTQEIIEIKYNEFLLDNMKNICDLGGLVRYNDDKVGNYIIDFKTMRQINKSTSFARMIKRTNIDGLQWDRSYTWKYLDENSNFKNYESQLQAQIENEFRLYVQGRRSSKYIFRFAPRPEQYEIDFIKMSQTNLTTYTRRSIQRV